MIAVKSRILKDKFALNAILKATNLRSPVRGQVNAIIAEREMDSLIWWRVAALVQRKVIGMSLASWYR